MEAIDYGADCTTFLCRGRENLAPVRTAHIATARDINFAGLQLIKRLREQAERLLLLSEYIDHQHRHRAAGEFHFFTQGLDRLWEELMWETEVVENVANDRRIEFASAESEEVDIRFPFWHR